MMNHARLVGAAVLCSWCIGCATQRPLNLTAQTGGSAFLFGQFQAFDGNSGRPMRFADVIDRCADADVILLGEQHGDAVCNQLEAQLFHALLAGGRPLVLAMEFFEADTQATLDAYLTRKLDEPAFIKQAKRTPAYLGTHRPLIELSRAARVPVLAANAPRRLVRDYRKSELDYPAYRAGLSPADQQWLPISSEPLEGPYRDRFAAIMSGHGDEDEDGAPASQPAMGAASQPTSRPAGHAASAPTEPPTGDAPAEAPPAPHPVSSPVSQPAGAAATQPASQPTSEAAAEMPASMPALPTWQELFKSQLLWDDAMAESIANYRERHPHHRALLVVGSFHVEREGGTVVKLRQRRPEDALMTIVYRAQENGQFAFDEEDHGAGDVVIYGLKPPKPQQRPTSMPIKMPEMPSAESQPASGPASMPGSAPTTTTRDPATPLEVRPEPVESPGDRPPHPVSPESP